MDPDATLRDLLDALSVQEWDRVEELANALLHWLENSGFPLMTLGAQSLGLTWHRSIATFVCREALLLAPSAGKRGT